MRHILKYFFVLLPTFLCAQPRYPLNVKQVLDKVGSNKPELQKALNYFYSKGDEMQIKAINFLIANMGIHRSFNYYWADGKGKRIPFNELNYPSFQASVQAFEAIRKKDINIHPVAYTYWDLDSIKASFLIDNVQRAFTVWRSPWAKNIPFEDFCEYILPYRVSIEPLQDWRKTYQEKFLPIIKSSRKPNTANYIDDFAFDYKNWFVNTYRIERRKEPLPRLGALQLLHRKKGPCEDAADLQVFMLRSQGIPSSLDIIPYWATSFGGHFINTAFDESNKPIHFDVTRYEDAKIKLTREPSKVLRITYSKQSNTLATIESHANIPEGALRLYNYKDVTSEYWETQSVTCKVFSQIAQAKTVYACVFNQGEWRPVWWGKADKGHVVFTNMSKGVVYLPTTYKNGKLTPAGYPVSVNNNGQQLNLVPKANKRSITMEQQEKYLIFREGAIYQLYYWDNGWKGVASKKAGKNEKQLVFENVPANALLLLRPNYSQGKERPFIITQEDGRQWF